MARKRGKKNTLKDKGSEDSDNDYMAEEDEVSDDGNDSDFYCSSFDGDEIEDNINDFEGDLEEKGIEKVVRSRMKIGSSKKRKNRSKISRKRKRVSYNQEEEDDDFENGEDDNDDGDDKEFKPEEEDMLLKRRRDLNNEEGENYGDDNFEEEEEDYDFEDEDDEEFTSEELYSLDEEDDLLVEKTKMNKKRVGKRVLTKQGFTKTRKRKRNSVVSKKPSVSKGRKRSNTRSRKVKNCDEHGFFTKKNPVMKEVSVKKPVRRKKRLNVESDSDFVSSGPSDHNFTISEEEREQVREANKLCKTLKVSLRSSYSSKKIEESVDNVIPPQRKTLVKKGKEKVEDVKGEVVKQVCGICLSEEGKRTIRGILNCCSHYFCFACIMEWSKVESRCPLCKQRFVTISKPGKSNTGIGPSGVVFQVPERDQIYQPSEEEIRRFIDPYEHVICSECHLGGDDSLMLLCDLCDSPAHTYCVGLGQEVPEGNWYCEGCRPVALASLNSQSENPSHDQRPINLNTIYENTGPTTLDSQFSRGFSASSPRYIGNDDILYSPRSGATTLSGRRHIHRQIHSFITSNRMRNNRTDEILAANFESTPPGFHFDHEVGPSNYNIFGENNHSLFHNEAIFPSNPSNFRRQVVIRDSIPSTSVGYAYGESRNGFSFGLDHHDRLRQYSSISTVSDGNEHVQSMVNNYLKSISTNLGLDNETYDDITIKSTHTILAACGLEHRTNEVYSLQRQPHPNCCHVDRQTSLMKGCCVSCFEYYTKHVVKTILNGKLPPFLWVRD